MAVSEAKLEANRRNAQKSTGPRTEAGKKRSSLNAVTHGLRAETLVLLDEDPQVLEDRRDGLACLPLARRRRRGAARGRRRRLHVAARPGQASPGQADQCQHHQLRSRPGPDQ